MKISKQLIQAIALALTVVTISACTKEKPIPPSDNPETSIPNCPLCGCG